MYQIFESFLNKMAASFRRVSRLTRNEMSLKDLHGDAWIVAHEIGARRGRTVDFSDEADQNLILGALNIRNVKRVEKNMWFASRIDETKDHDEGAINVWSNRLRAPETSAPLKLMILREDMAKDEAAIDSSFSEYAAYIVTLFQFMNDRVNVCAYLVIADGTLRRRMNYAENQVKVQASLFDRMERIDESFMPLPGRQYALRPGHQYSATQWGWEF